MGPSPWLEPVTIELHCHTTCSDGLLSPTQLLARAHQHGVRVLSITDHDTLAAYNHPEVPNLARSLGIELLPGVEISTLCAGYEIHMLAYLVDGDHAALESMLAGIRSDRHRRYQAMLDRAAELQLRLVNLPPSDTHLVLGRAHVARAMVAAGSASSIREAFDRYLSSGRPLYVPKQLAPVEQVVAVVRQAGGVAVVAHPGRYARTLDIEALKGAGMQGIEVAYPTHTRHQKQSFAAMASRLELIPTGGSDFHGDRGASELGSQQLGVDVIDRLRAASA